MGKTSGKVGLDQGRAEWFMPGKSTTEAVLAFIVVVMKYSPSFPLLIASIPSRVFTLLNTISSLAP